MIQHLPLDPSEQAGRFGIDETRRDRTCEVAPDVAYKRLMIVNVVFIGPPQAADREWVLVDAGLPGSKKAILNAAMTRFGSTSRPAAIIQTHGHFDHVGALRELADIWDAPIYAHALEHPYLNGRAAYPPPDPSVGGGMMSTLSPLYPRGPIDVGHRLKMLPHSEEVPGLTGWRWIHTPGHTPGHVSLWRESDRTLISGDAVITTAQESVYSVLMQSPQMHGPPMYYTQNWDEARLSVEKLADLEPELIVPGHGLSMRGPNMRAALHHLAQDFTQIAVPANGRYVQHPTRGGSSDAFLRK